MSAGPRLMVAVGLACAGLGLVGAGAGATFTAQVSGTMTVTSGTVGLSLNGQSGSDVELDLDGQELGPHFASISEDLVLANTGTLDLARTSLSLTSPECGERDATGDAGPGRGGGDGPGDDGALARALHVTMTDLTHGVTEYDGPLCAAALADRGLGHAPAVGESIHYQLVLRAEDEVRGLPPAARHAEAGLRITFTGFDR